MRALRIIAALLLMAPAIAFAGDKVKTVVIQTSINCDHCKQCESCSGRIERALYNKKGIKRVDIDDASMQIKVVYNTEKINPDDIRQAIAASGYNADNVTATPEAIGTLDDCCRKGEKE